MPERTPNGKVIVYDPSTGQQVERWPVDARELVERCGFSYTPDAEPGGKEVSTEVDQGAVKALLGTSVRDLREAVEKLNDPALLSAAIEADDRVTAVATYQARLDTLEGKHALGDEVPLKAVTEAGDGKPAA